MSRYRILVVDDEKPITRMVRAIVERSVPSEVIEHNDGNEAIEYYREHAADVHLIICDLRMPGLNGMQFCRLVREKSDTVPIIILTAYASDDVEAEAREVGANEFVQKPFLPRPFIGAIRRLLGEPEE